MNNKLKIWEIFTVKGVFILNKIKRRQMLLNVFCAKGLMELSHLMIRICGAISRALITFQRFGTPINLKPKFSEKRQGTAEVCFVIYARKKIRTLT